MLAINPPVHRFRASRHAHEMLTDSKHQDLLAIALWGPPGCGKSSAVAHLQVLLDDTNMLIFNVLFYIKTCPTFNNLLLLSNFYVRRSNTYSSFTMLLPLL